MAKTDLLRVCSYCKHPIADDDMPVEAITITDPESLGVPVSHGACIPCMVGERKKLADYKAARARSKKA